MVGKQQLLQTIYDEPYQIGKWCGYDKLTELHNDWLKSFLWKDEDQTIQGHRGSYKTTCIALFLCIHLIIKPNETVLFFRKTDNDVAAVIREVDKILRTGAFRQMVKILYDVNLTILKSNTSEIETNLHTGTAGVSQITALGIGTSITGKHADIVITDDIVNISDRISRAEREKTKLQYQELQNIKNRGGRFINTGTPWHKDDAFVLMSNIKKYDCYSTGLISEEELKGIRHKMTPSLFSANYELKHIADEKALFSSPHFLDRHYIDEYERTVTELLFGGICHIDAAYGGDDATAITYVNKDKYTGRLIVLGKKYEGHVDDKLDEILTDKEYYRLGTTHCETNADKGYLAKELMQRGDYVETYSESMNKYYKIASYLRKNWDNIYFHPDTDPEYIEQILDYTEHADHDDCPDSLASAVRIYEEETGITHYKEGF